MALTPGGGRSPSTQSPPSPPPAGQRRAMPGGRKPATPRAAGISVVRWGVLIGGLVIIADLASQAISQRSVSQDDINAIGGVDEIANYILFSILGILVVRDTGAMFLGAAAGVFASLLDAIVVAAAASMVPPPAQAPSVEEIFVRNLVIGVVFAGSSGVVYALVQRWSGGRNKR